MRAATFGNFESRAHQSDEVHHQEKAHGTISLGAALSGWLVAAATGVLLTVLMVILGSGFALTITDMSLANLTNNALIVNLVGAFGIVATFAVAYFAGGYVAGRMSDSDGARQGLGVWIVGSIATVALVIGGASMASSYGLISSMNLSGLATSNESLTASSLATMAAALVISALAAVTGGRVGAASHQSNGDSAHST